MKIKFLPLVCIACLSLLWSCNDDEKYDYFGGIYGMISDAETKNPIVGAQVILSPGNVTTVTGSDGNYEFQNLEAGQYKLSVSSSGYSVNTRQVTVVSGEKIICDMQLVREKSVSGMELSTNVLDFGSVYDELAFSIRNVGTSGTMNWYIDNISVNWLEVSPIEGSTDMGKSSSIKVIVDRAQVTSSETTVFNVNAAGGSMSIMVYVDQEDQGSGDDNPGDDNPGDDNPGDDNPGDDNPGDDNPGDDNPGDGYEDYSSANVESGDYRIIPEIVSCRRSGSSVTLEYTLRNDGLGQINDFRIYTTNSNSLINGAYRTIITDEDYNNYIESNYTFNGQSSSQNYVLTSTFPEGVKCKGTVVVKNFESSSERLTVVLGVWCYDLYPDQLSDPRIYFEDVPVY